MWEDENFVKELNRRTKELENGQVKGYTWDEVKEITRKSLQVCPYTGKRDPEALRPLSGRPKCSKGHTHKWP